MDEITLVRDLYGKVPEDPAMRERIRARLTAPAPAPRPSRRRTMFGLGLVAAATAAVLTAGSLLTAGSSGPPPPGPGASPPRDVRSILLAAAERAAKEPPGRYWRLHTTSGVAYRVKGGYLVEGHRSEYDEWTARSQGDPDFLFSRDLGARPQTPVDEAAWREQGSPERWNVVSNGDRRVLTSAPSGWSTDRTSPLEKERLARAQRLQCKDAAWRQSRACQLLALSPDRRDRRVSDPKYLQKVLAESRPVRRPGAPPQRWVPPVSPETPRIDMLGVFAFLTGEPVAPEVRAAAFRLLAEMPGIRSLGTVRDRSGRPGVGLAVRVTAEGSTYDQVIVLDPVGHRILGEHLVVVDPGRGRARGMAPGTVESHTVVHHAGWTNEMPEKP